MIDALLRLGCSRRGAGRCSGGSCRRRRSPSRELHVLYRLDGGVGIAERTLAAGRLSRTRGRCASATAPREQTQLDIYGELLRDRVAVQRGASRDRRGHRRRARAHRRPRLRHLARARLGHLGGAQRPVSLHALEGDVLGGARSRRPAGRARRAAVAIMRRAGRREAAAICAFVEDAVLVRAARAATRARRQASEPRTDASLLMLPLVGYGDPRGARMSGTIDAVEPHAAARRLRLSLSGRQMVCRGKEGCFLNCSFWLVSALARNGRVRRSARR